MTETAAQPEYNEMNEVPNPDPVSAPASGAEPARPALESLYTGQRQPFDPREKSPRLAAVLSAIPGLGQVYIGYYVRGLTLASTMLLLVLMANTVHGDIAPLFGFASAFLWVFNVVDAGRMAALYNHAMAGARSIELPADFKMPEMGGSIVGGLLLAGFGALALSNTAFGYDIDWVETYWPLLPLGLGLYLLARGVMERNAS